MRKYFIPLLIIVLLVLVIPKDSPEFRIRVIANSNSLQDQNLKMEVVNALLLEIRKYDEENLEVEIKTNINKIDRVVENVLKDSQYSLAIKKVRFPPKELNDEIIKGGRYETLIVVIGEGKGKNWWSLLNPNYNFGFEDSSGDDVEFKFYFFEFLK